MSSIKDRIKFFENTGHDKPITPLPATRPKRSQTLVPPVKKEEIIPKPEIHKEPETITKRNEVNKSASNIEKLSKDRSFFSKSLTNIFTEISKVDFSDIDDTDKTVEIVQNFIKNTITSHSTEKETILLLNNINTTEIDLSLENILSFLILFTNCPLLQQLNKLYHEDKQFVSRDFEYDLKVV